MVTRSAVSDMMLFARSCWLWYVLSLGFLWGASATLKKTFQSADWLRRFCTNYNVTVRGKVKLYNQFLEFTGWPKTQDWLGLFCSNYNVRERKAFQNTGWPKKQAKPFIHITNQSNFDLNFRLWNPQCGWRISIGTKGMDKDETIFLRKGLFQHHQFISLSHLSYPR